MSILLLLRRRLALLITLVLLTGLVAPVASAASTTLCTGYAGCASTGRGDGGYAANSGVRYWGMEPGHNCTNYAAYRLMRNGANAGYLQNHGMAREWGSRAAQYGVPVNSTPAVGAIAWWAANSGGSGPSGHVAYVEEVGPGYIIVSEDNSGGNFHWKKMTPGGYYPTGFIHFKDIGATPPQPSPSPPGQPGAITALEHGSRVNLVWGAATGATDYLVYRNGSLLAMTTGPTFLDMQVSSGQPYTYAVAARNGAGSSASVSARVSTASEAADRAYLTTNDGPALCGRAGDPSWQSLTCTVHTATGWNSVYAPKGDWGYAQDRTWLTNTDGTVSYCRLVNTGNQALCDRFDGTTWTVDGSPPIDPGYPENRAFLSTGRGPALCGRAGDPSWQSLVCTVSTPTGWISVYSPGGDWGYAQDRTWLTNTDGTVSYCRLVNTGNQVMCDRFDGTTWTSSTSPQIDPAYSDNRTFLSTSTGPALCGRAGDPSWQSLICTVHTSTGWTSAYSPGGDWGYHTDRAWLTNTDRSVSYCRLINTGNQVMCDRFDGTTWTTSTSPAADVGYPDNRTFLTTHEGPALCGRAGDQDWQSLTCTVHTPTGWTSAYSPGGDWGYHTDRAWLTNTDHTISYCRRINTGNQIMCDRFDGTTWTTSTSPAADVGYSDTF